MEKQNENKTSLRDIEEELLSANNNALEEEKINVKRHYQYFQDKLDYYEKNVPFPDVKEDDKPVDYDDMVDLNSKKARNREFLDKQQYFRPFCTTGKLCCGHVKREGSDFFITQVKGLHSMRLTEDHRFIMLIHTDDKIYQPVLKQWRHPSDEEDVEFSRIIRMQNKEVTDVDVLLDRTSDSNLDVTDAFLKQALRRNKDNLNITSIIETIQKQQDDIRLMPADASFIVQGCAGSGKTMVLLHRLRYLLFNEDIKNSEYVMLVPSNQFKEFISDIAEEFDIYHRNIMPYTEYYQFALGQKASHEEKNELLLPEEMLDDVYSKDFIRNCYKNVITNIHEQNQGLLDYIENCLSNELDLYSFSLEKEIKATNDSAVQKISGLISSFERYLDQKEFSSLDNTVALRREIMQIINSQKKLEEKRKTIEVKPVLEDDERILYDERVQSLQNDLTREENALAKATIFSRGIHKRKVAQLSIQMETLKKQIVQELQEIDYKRAFDGLEENKIFSIISLDELSSIYEQIGSIYNDSTKIIRSNKEKLKNIEDEHIPQFLIKPTNGFNELYEQLTMFESVKELYADEVNPISGYLPKYIIKCTEVMKKVDELFSDDLHKKSLQETAPMFMIHTEDEVQNQFCNMLMDEANRILSEKYQQTLDDSYKYYWYLLLYFTYLSKEVKGRFPHYIYIDESQDLSSSEIELINRIHTINKDGKTEPPVMDLFGDVNQTITNHGIKSWGQVDFIPGVFRLDENFRNTNQIVDYCNTKLSMNMTKVGVDMKDVNEYDDLQDYIDNLSSYNPVYVVKDEQTREKLNYELSEVYGIDNATVYTVKEAKGLEFKDVIVLMKKMTRNERYIAYTRALANLSVVKEL